MSRGYSKSELIQMREATYDLVASGKLYGAASMSREDMQSVADRIARALNSDTGNDSRPLLTVRALQILTAAVAEASEIRLEAVDHVELVNGEKGIKQKGASSQVVVGHQSF